MTNTGPKANLMHPNRRHFLPASGAAASLMLDQGAQAQANPTQSPEILGPILGDATPSSMMVWIRVISSGRYTLEVRSANGHIIGTWQARASAANDYCLMWTATGLNPGNRYHYCVLHEAALSPMRQSNSSPPRPPARPLAK